MSKKLHTRTYTDVWSPSVVGVSTHHDTVTIEAKAPEQGALLRLNIPAWEARDLATELLRALRKLKEKHEESARWAETLAVRAIEDAKTDPPKPQ